MIPWVDLPGENNEENRCCKILFRFSTFVGNFVLAEISTRNF